MQIGALRMFIFHMLGSMHPLPSTVAKPSHKEKYQVHLEASYYPRVCDNFRSQMNWIAFDPSNDT